MEGKHGGIQKKKYRSEAASKRASIRKGIVGSNTWRDWVETNICSRAGKLHTAVTSVLDALLGFNIETIKGVHGIGILENFGHLGTRGNQLQHIPIILDGSGLMFGSVPHLQRILQHGDELFDLAVIQDPGRDAALGGQPF